jgi:hypothetical protein
VIKNSFVASAVMNTFQIDGNYANFISVAQQRNAQEWRQFLTQSNFLVTWTAECHRADTRSQWVKGFTEIKLSQTEVERIIEMIPLNEVTLVLNLTDSPLNIPETWYSLFGPHLTFNQQRIELVISFAENEQVWKQECKGWHSCRKSCEGITLFFAITTVVLWPLAIAYAGGNPYRAVRWFKNCRSC